MNPYKHRAQYYETDQMGVIHHSNYIRWMESARVDAMSQKGIEYGHMEASGLISPVLSVNCEYKSMVYFNDVVLIYVKIKSYNGIKLSFAYTLIDQPTGELRVTGESSHCFLDSMKRLVSLKKVHPKMHVAFREWDNESSVNTF